MDGDTIKHLELIQEVVARLARNSFTYKGWAITLVSAIFVLAARQVKAPYLFTALIPAIFFWGLDGYYLRQERLFRKLYDKVREVGTQGLGDGPFSMNTEPFKGSVASWFRICLSKMALWLYLPLTIVVVWELLG